MPNDGDGVGAALNVLEKLLLGAVFDTNEPEVVA